MKKNIKIVGVMVVIMVAVLSFSITKAQTVSITPSPASMSGDTSALYVIPASTGRIFNPNSTVYVSLNPSSPPPQKIISNPGDTVLLGIFDIKSSTNSSILKTLSFDVVTSGGKQVSDVFSNVNVKISNGSISLAPQLHMTYNNINKVLPADQNVQVYVTGTFKEGIPSGTKVYTRLIANNDNIKAVDVNVKSVAVEPGTFTAAVKEFVAPVKNTSALFDSIMALFGF